jgi:hypothetical protein
MAGTACTMEGRALIQICCAMQAVASDRLQPVARSADALHEEGQGYSAMQKKNQCISQPSSHVRTEVLDAQLSKEFEHQHTCERPSGGFRLFRSAAICGETLLDDLARKTQPAFLSSLSIKSFTCNKSS